MLLLQKELVWAESGDLLPNDLIESVRKCLSKHDVLLERGCGQANAWFKKRGVVIAGEEHIQFAVKE